MIIVVIAMESTRYVSIVLMSDRADDEDSEPKPRSSATTAATENGPFYWLISCYFFGKY